MQRHFLVIFMILFSFCLFAQGTELKLYRPFGEVINQAPALIKKRSAGHCLGQSQRIKREDAWRCIVNNQVYDPCFVDPFASHQQVICPQSPWEGFSLQIDLSSPVEPDKNSKLDMSRTYPWALELATGEQCQAIDEGLFFDKMPVRYLCNDQSILVGYLARCKAQWSILRRKQDKVVVTAWVRKAWF